MDELDLTRLDRITLFTIVGVGIFGNFLLAMIETNFDPIVGGQIFVVAVCSFYIGQRHQDRRS